MVEAERIVRGLAAAGKMDLLSVVVESVAVVALAASAASDVGWSCAVCIQRVAKHYFKQGKMRCSQVQ